MTDNNEFPVSGAPEEGVGDLLARLYREIGISAVAAALAVTGPKPADHAESAGALYAPEDAPGKDLAA
jgi:hypothetical protein